MIQALEFLQSVLDAINDHIVVIDQHGSVLYVNRSWDTFSHKNNGSSIDWENANYLTVCENAAKNGDDFGQRAFNGIHEVINGDRQEFYLEYPCHGPSEKRWFMMNTTSFINNNTTYFVISHRNITKRKMAEEEVQTLSQTDALTALFNRRHFDDYLNLEWQRCSRLQTPISLAIIDIDHFKMINDTYGHVAGDESLQRIAQLLQQFTQRPSDMCARYGGEEFVVVYGNTHKEHAQQLLNQFITSVRQLTIPNKHSPTSPYLTVSIGLATTYPSQHATQTQLLKTADTMLYMAKENGRNQIMTSHTATDNTSAPTSALTAQRAS